MKTAASFSKSSIDKKPIDVIEVGLRDGLQNIKTILPTPDKVMLGKMLIEAGLKELEITSFVSPKWVPQMADASDVVSILDEWRISQGLDVKFVALAPNYRGVLNGLTTKVDEFSMPISVSEKHNKDNVNMTIDESFAELERITRELKAPIKVGLATSFGSPYDNDLIDPRKVAIYAKRALNSGAKHIILSDTVGNGNPLFVSLVLDEVLKNIKKEQISLHFHNTLGMGLANVLIGLKFGITRFESAIGGLGGCPFAPGAAGNIATEDLCFMLKSMGFQVPVDVIKLQKIDNYIANAGLTINSSLYKFISESGGLPPT